MLAAWMFVAICPIMQEFISLHSAILWLPYIAPFAMPYSSLGRIIPHITQIQDIHNYAHKKNNVKSLFLSDSRPD